MRTWSVDTSAPSIASPAYLEFIRGSLPVTRFISLVKDIVSWLPVILFSLGICALFEFLVYLLSGGSI